jgi:glucose/arabinose dehydrogenase
MLRPVLALTLTLFVVTDATAQLRIEEFVSGFSRPVAFVQDPTDAGVQHVVEQGGRIRVVRNGLLQAADFLDLTSVVSSDGERGLLGLAFAPDYATSRRLYVNFTNTAGHTVVSRFLRSANDPLRAVAASRFDLLWPSGERFVRQPFSNHNGGNLAFGPDGFLYIGLGDGGSGNDPDHLAQDMSTPLGKMLRIDVSVPDTDAAGYLVPPDNPFVGTAGALGEIWAIGLRNPWRYSFDDPLRGGTGALLVADVGQNAWEEINHEPAGLGGRNYGWRNREGAHDNVTSRPPAYLPLIDPIFEYGHSVGRSIAGGFVYRGTSLGSAFRGRYFFADFVMARVWSIALVTNTATGETAASDLREHTSELGGSATLGSISSFGLDASGELYVVSWDRGAILRISGPRPIAPLMQIDAPAPGARLRQPFMMGGWTLDLNATSGSGIDLVHVWAYPASGAAPIFVGGTTAAGSRPDVGAVYGAQFAASGFGLGVRGLTPGAYQLVAYGHVVETRAFDVARLVGVTIESGVLLTIDGPIHLSTVDRPFSVGGWALDGSAASGSGVDAIHIYAYPVAPATGPPIFLGVPTRGPRPDVAAAFGSQFIDSGYNLIVSALAPGTWDIVVYARSAASGAFETARVVRAIVR